MFAKVFSQIFTSSISKDRVVRYGFMDLLVLADRDGVVDMTAEAIARITNVPTDVVAYYLAELQKPDAESRTPTEDGCRIVLLSDHRNWGWKIVNYHHYRELRSEDDRREYMRTYMRKRRVNSSKQMLTPLAKAEADTDTEAYNPSPVPTNGNGRPKKSSKVTDPRHMPFKELIFRCYQKLNDGQSPPWDGSDAKQLDLLLKAAPMLTEENMKVLLTNYFYSKDHSPGDRPRKFLPNLMSYSTVLNKFRREEDQTK